MRCKVCNRELIEGTRRCPHCGAEVSSPDDSSAEEFKWNVQDFPKPKKKKDVSIDWKSGRILDKEAGLVYDQSLNGWTEPEDVGELFSFDTQNEKLQQKLDREMARIAVRPASGQRRGSSGISSDTIDFHILDEPAGRRKSSADGGSADAAKQTEKRNGKDRLRFSSESSPRTPDTPDMENPWKHLREQRTEKKTKTEKTAATPTSDITNAPATNSDSIYEKDIFTPEPLHFHRLSDSLKPSEAKKSAEMRSEDTVSEMRQLSRNAEISDTVPSGFDSGGNVRSDSVAADQKSGDPAKSPETASENRENSFFGDKKTPSEENVLSGFRKLIEAEKKFKEDMEKISYLSPEEYKEAEKAESQSQKLKFVPTISFRTIEDEYESYRREHPAENGQALPEDAGSRTDFGKNRTDAEPDKKENGKDKEIQIKINEPSGTKFTVKTQEISLASLNNDASVRTQEVDLDAVKKPPKNVQVSVEVNAAQGNASVEVTRRHDGATVVKTLDESNAGHVYLDGKDITEEPETADTVVNAADSTDAAARAGEANKSETDKDETDKTEKTDDTAEIQENTEMTEIPENPADSGISGAEQNKKVSVPRTLPPEAVASGLASSEAVQQTIQIATASPDACGNGDADHADDADHAGDTDDTAETSADAASGRSTDGPKADGEDETDPLPDAESSPAGPELSGISPVSGISEDSSSETPDGSRFWEKSDDISKMTITDIFGPDAHKIMEEGIRYRFGAQPASKNSAEAKSAESVSSAPAADAENDAARKTSEKADGTDAGQAGSAENNVPEEKEKSGEDNKKQDDSLILDIRPEDIAPSASQTAALHMPSLGSESAKTRGVTTDTISEERQAEMKEAFEALDTINEAERRRLLKEEKKAERDRLRQKREAARAEKAERRARAKAEKEKSSDTAPEKSGSFRADSADSEKKSFGPVAKGLIIALTVILIVEFLIIGIKLFAPDSGAAALIDRFESQMSSIFSEEPAVSVPAADDVSGYDILSGTSSGTPASDSPSAVI